MHARCRGRKIACKCAEQSRLEFARTDSRQAAPFHPILTSAHWPVWKWQAVILRATVAGMTTDQARQLMQEWTTSPALRGHMEAVAACMGAYAQKLEPDNIDRWI